MAKTFKRIIGDGYITHGDDGTKYTTTKDLVGDGYTTHGSDGSTYKTHKSLLWGDLVTQKTSGSSIGGEIGGGLGCFAIAFLILQICLNALTWKSYLYVAGLFILPRLSGLFERIRLSRIWCAGLMFCFMAFGTVGSIQRDVRVLAGTKRGGEGLIVLVVLFMILLAGLMFAIFTIGEEVLALLSAFILLVSVSWCYFDVIHHIPHTNDMKKYALVALLIIGIIDQLKLLIKKN